MERQGAGPRFGRLGRAWAPTLVRAMDVKPLDPEPPFVIWLAAQVHRDDDIGKLARRSLATSPSDPETLQILHRAIAEWGARPKHR